ncbi:MAG: glycosyltransferase family 2 protein [Deltaproteobacteria bacterium]|nr:glycosyltransferase family 2 protein [Deltaproteobacteria bacterium]
MTPIPPTHIDPVPHSLSVVLPAYNEAESIAEAITEVYQFCSRHVSAWEIVIVNDGSTDDTIQRVTPLLCDSIKLISHPRNRGMGASLKSGYDAATCDYIVALPADRQIRADSLRVFLPLMDENTVIIGQYPTPHGGIVRAVMSKLFRVLTVHVGRLSVDVTGAYLFPAALYAQSDVPSDIASSTFLYSFQLLEAFKQHGARFMDVAQIPFRREKGYSRIARPGRIVRVAIEILLHRYHHRRI